jgi:hypothetical protein
MLTYDTEVPTLTYPHVARTAPNKIAKTQAQFVTLVAGLAVGDWLAVQGVTFTGEIALAKTLASYAKISFDSACKFVGVTTNTNLPALWIKEGCSYLQFVFQGCPITNAKGGMGILQHASHHIVLDGFFVHDVGGHGVYAAPIGGDIHDCFYRGEAYNIGLNHNLDPHTVKGSGLHCILAGDTGQGKFRNNRVAIYGHDSVYSGGSILELGDGNTNYPSQYNDIWLKGERILFQGASSGNGVNAWGHLNHNTFHCIDVDEMAGKAVLADPYEPFTGTVVQQGTATSCCQGGWAKGQSPWDPKGGIVYQNVSAT